MSSWKERLDNYKLKPIEFCAKHYSKDMTLIKSRNMGVIFGRDQIGLFEKFLEVPCVCGKMVALKLSIPSHKKHVEEHDVYEYFALVKLDGYWNLIGLHPEEIQSFEEELKNDYFL